MKKGQMSERKLKEYDQHGSNDLLTKKPSRSFSMRNQKNPDIKLRSTLTKVLSHFDRAGDDASKVKRIREMWELMEATWQLPVIGRELAYEFSDILRREKVLSYLISKLNLDGGTPDIQRECARLLEQILTTDNRHYVTKHALDVISKYTRLKDDLEIIRINTGILESLFKDSENTCTRLIDLGALDSILHACRHDDLWTARHCAAGLANAAIFGGSVNHKRMVNKGMQEWLFPLAFRSDDYCRYYACLAITVLAANPSVEKYVVKSGTLELVEPFVSSHDPYEFAQSNPSHAQGRSASFLQRLIPLLLSDRSEAQALASFYFAMESSIKAKQQKTQLFSEIFAIIPLKRVIATSRSNIARILAGRCLKIIGEEVPRKLSPQIHLWDIEDVQSWLTVAGFRGFQSSFRDSTVDGEMLLLLTERDLKEDLKMVNNVHRKRFIRDLNRLRTGADYRSVDSSGICDWLRLIEPQFSQYTFRLLQAGVDRSFLPYMTDVHLREDCGIENGIHRTRILNSVEKLGTSSSLTSSRKDLENNHDVFISYRRNNGSHLASLLKVHLQLRGFRVFLDVESLKEGDFADRTLRSVKAVSAGFILVLTAGALDKCAIDHERTDWLHKEISTAISNGVNIVPVTTESFKWPLPEDLPKDISPICFYNGVKWIHDYQEACIDKVERFLRGHDLPTGKLSRISSVQGSRDGLGSSSQKRSIHPNHPVRPSGSTDNLVNGDRYPRPRQRASPPGQAAYLSTAAAGRGFTGAQSESARSLHQGDGASAPYEQLPKQYQPPATGSADQTSKQKPGSTSSASTSSSKKIPPKGIKKDLIRLEEVISGNSERSKESESESSTSGEYSSGDESDGGWEKKEIERGGADGKSKAHPSNLGKDHMPNEAVEPSKQKDQIPAAVAARLERIGSKKLPGMEGVYLSTHVSPGQKPKSSSKYKAPSPPSLASPSKDDRVPESKSDVPESKPRPVQRQATAEKGNVILSARSEPGSGNKMLPKSGRSVAQQPLLAVSESNLPKKVLSKPRSEDESQKRQDVVGDKSSSKIQFGGPTASPRSNDHRDVSSHIPNETAEEKQVSSITDGQLSESDYSSLEEGSKSGAQSEDAAENHSTNGLRTIADGNEGASASNKSRSISTSTPSNLGAKPIKNPNANENNNNNTQMNGAKTPADIKKHPNSVQNSNAKLSPLTTNKQPTELSAYHGSSPVRKQDPNILAARRDVAPAEVTAPARRSASERLQMTRPHGSYPAYPRGVAASNLPPYHQPMTQAGYQAAMAGVMTPPYPASQPYKYSAVPGQQVESRGLSTSHGFDTAV